MVDKSEKRPATELEMKKNVGSTRVSPAFVKWSDEIENNPNAARSNGKDSSSPEQGESSGASSLKTTRTQNIDRSISESKISTSNVKVAFAKDNSHNNTQTSKMRLIFTSMGKLVCLPSCFKVEFASRQLEEIYQRYYCRQKLDRILYIILLDFVVNLCLIAMYSAVFNKSSSTQVSRLIVTCTFCAINLSFIVLYFLKLFPPRIFKWLPYIVWFTVFFQLQVDLAIGYDPLVPSDSVGMFAFFMFISNVMLPASLPLCTALALLAGIGHIVITSIFAKQNREYFGRQVSELSYTYNARFLVVRSTKYNFRGIQGNFSFCPLPEKLLTSFAKSSQSTLLGNSRVDALSLPGAYNCRQF